MAIRYIYHCRACEHFVENENGCVCKKARRGRKISDKSEYIATIPEWCPCRGKDEETT